jgi:hypothetical protein
MQFRVEMHNCFCFAKWLFCQEVGKAFFYFKAERALLCKKGSATGAKAQRVLLRKMAGVFCREDEKAFL